MDRRELAAKQLRELAVLDEAHRTAAGTALGWGAAFSLIGLGFPAMKVLGTIASAAVPSSTFFYRMANVPIWVIALMMLCGCGIGAYGIVLGIRMRGASAPSTAHLRACPDDPFVDVQSQVEVRRGYRAVHHWLTSERGVRTHEVVPASHEARVAQALASAIAPRS